MRQCRQCSRQKKRGSGIVDHRQPDLPPDRPPHHSSSRAASFRDTPPSTPSLIDAFAFTTASTPCADERSPH